MRCLHMGDKATTKVEFVQPHTRMEYCMNKDADRERLSQAKMLAWLNRKVPVAEMITVYLS